jgi:DNA-binding transcriptional MerR regulator
VSSGRRLLRSGELAKLAGVSPDTLRLYERKGLLARTPRTANGYRAYPPDALDRVRLVRAALSIGFTLDELTEILAERDGGGAPCTRVRDLAGAKLENLEGQLRVLRELRDRLRTVLRDWDLALETTPSTKRARLLEALAATAGPGEPNLFPRLLPSFTKPVRKGKEPRHDQD